MMRKSSRIEVLLTLVFSGDGQAAHNAQMIYQLKMDRIKKS